MPTGSITSDQVDFVETWENISQSTNFIITLDPRGEEKHEGITGRRNFTLTTQERIITQSRIVDPKNDPFTNGCFRPVITPDDITLDSNPNALSDEDILKIFKASHVAWSEWLNTVDSDATLRRMVDLADDSDDITHKRVNDLKRRLAEVTGGPKHAVQKDEEQYRALAGDGKPEDRKKAAKRSMTSSTPSTSSSG